MKWEVREDITTSGKSYYVIYDKYNIPLPFKMGWFVLKECLFTDSMGGFWGVKKFFSRESAEAFCKSFFRGK
jgi:hypothetical protein